jgi:3-dehydroquinate dehydratase
MDFLLRIATGIDKQLKEIKELHQSYNEENGMSKKNRIMEKINNVTNAVGARINTFQTQFETKYPDKIIPYKNMNMNEIINSIQTYTEFEDIINNVNKPIIQQKPNIYSK